MAKRTARCSLGGKPEGNRVHHAARLSPRRAIGSFSTSCPNGWVPFTRVHLGQRVEKICARSLAEHATSNTTEEANDRCRTPDDSTAEEKHSDQNRTTPATRQAPAWAPFTFQGLSRELRHAAHGRFVEARPPRPTSTRLRPRRARNTPSGGSIVAKTKTHTGPRRRMARKDWRQPWQTRRNGPRLRATGGATSG